MRNAAITILLCDFSGRGASAALRCFWEVKLLGHEKCSFLILKSTTQAVPVQWPYQFTWSGHFYFSTPTATLDIVRLWATSLWGGREGTRRKHGIQRRHYLYPRCFNLFTKGILDDLGNEKLTISNSFQLNSPYELKSNRSNIHWANTYTKMTTANGKKGCEGHWWEVAMWLLMMRWMMVMMAAATLCQAWFLALCICKFAYSLHQLYREHIILSILQIMKLKHRAQTFA